MTTQSYDCCYKCTKRVVGCHSTCSEYIETRKKFEAERNIVYEKRNEERRYSAYESDRAFKAKKRANKK